MEFLNAQAKYVAEQLRGMSFSQRVAIILLVVILVGGMWGLIQWSRQPAWTPLLDQQLSAEDVQRVEAQLALLGEETKVEGDRILVRGGQDARRRLHALLAQKNALPKDISLTYMSLIQEDNVWESDQKSRWKQYRALEVELSMVVAGFSGVDAARVQIVVPERRSLSRRVSTASASVKVELGGGQALGKQKVLAIASYIAGAVPGLEVRNVTITDGSQSYRPRDPSEGPPPDLLDIQRKHENHYAQKIYDQLKHIRGIVVNVHAKLRQNDEHRRAVKLGPTQVSKERAKSQESTGPSLAGGPGVRPNTGRNLGETTPGTASTIEEAETEFAGLRDEERIDSDELRGTLEQLTVSINVPRSYLLRILEAQQPGTTDASAAAIQKIADVELPKIRDHVKPLIGATDTKDRELVVVDWYQDMPEEDLVAPVTAQLGVVALARDFAPQAGLGLLAAFSLFMVFRIAKKAQHAFQGSAAAAEAAGPETPLESISAGTAAVGEVQEMDGILVGQEVDENTVRIQQIVKQIGDMVEDDPAIASNIVEHWLGDQQ
jgi:flagellar M-ring protein FliF